MKLAEWNKDSKARLWILLWAAIQLIPMSLKGSLWWLSFATCLFCLAGWGLIGILQRRSRNHLDDLADRVRIGRKLLTEFPHVQNDKREELERITAEGEAFLKKHGHPYPMDRPFRVKV